MMFTEDEKQAYSRITAPNEIKTKIAKREAVRKRPILLYSVPTVVLAAMLLVLILPMWSRQNLNLSFHGSNVTQNGVVLTPEDGPAMARASETLTFVFDIQAKEYDLYVSDGILSTNPQEGGLGNCLMQAEYKTIYWSIPNPEVSDTFELRLINYKETKVYILSYDAGCSSWIIREN